MTNIKIRQEEKYASRMSPTCLWEKEIINLIRTESICGEVLGSTFWQRIEIVQFLEV